jgi:hypothetical protein
MLGKELRNPLGEFFVHFFLNRLRMIAPRVITTPGQAEQIAQLSHGKLPGQFLNALIAAFYASETIPKVFFESPAGT